MKRIKILLALLTVTATTQVYAQDNAFAKGDKVISLGYGFPNLNKTLFSIFEDEEGFNVKGYGPIHGKFEYGLSNVVGIGLSVNHVSTDVEFNDAGYNYTYKLRSTKFNLRTNFHFTKNEKVDVFAGVGGGYGINSNKLSTNDPDLTDLVQPASLPAIGFELTLGTRFFVANNVAIYAEVGAAKSILQFGASYRLRGLRD